MRQNSTLKKMNSYLCVIDTLKFRTHFLIIRHIVTRVLARALGTYVVRGISNCLLASCDYGFLSSNCYHPLLLRHGVQTLRLWRRRQLFISSIAGSCAIAVRFVVTFGVNLDDLGFTLNPWSTRASLCTLLGRFSPCHPMYWQGCILG